MSYIWNSVLLIIHLCLVSPQPSVIIIGAGPAGIAAATRLLENSVTNLTLLEAENRIGGRINSLKFISGIIDLGAQYCHGVKGNVVYELAKDYSILKPGLRGLQSNIYYSNGTKLDLEFVTELQEFYFNYHTREDDDFNMTRRSLGDFIVHKYLNPWLGLHQHNRDFCRYEKTFFKKYGSDGEKMKLLQEGLEFLQGYVIIHEGAFSWFHSSAECDYTECQGPQNLIWERLGYKTVLEMMTKEFPDSRKKLPIDDKIHLNTSVAKIIWNRTESVEVLTNNGRFSADYVIFTPSVGVLKRNKNTMFEPPLLPSKKNAIDATGFEGVIKVFFHFPTKWWKDDEEAFGFFWAEEDLVELDRDEARMFWISQFRYIMRVPGNSRVWLGWISGDLVPEIEKLPLDVFKFGCEYALNKFLSKTHGTTRIGSLVRSAWVTNENFGGTYSYTKTGFYEKNRSYQAVLAEPLSGVGGKPAVLFAGEATNPTHYSTVHGAIETGYREAERIINLHAE